jgi:hypothetical protein
MAVKLIHHSHNPENGDTLLGLSIGQFEEATETALFRRIVEITAEKYVSENYEAIIKNLDQRAVATLALARAGQFIGESITTSKIAEAVGHLETAVKDVLSRQRRI